MKIVADIDIPFLKGLPEKFADEVVYFSTPQFSHEKIKDADALIVRTPDKCTREILEGTNVKFIATASVGFDHIDIDYCRQQKIGWANAPGCNACSVAQYFFSVLVQLSLTHQFDLRRKKIGLVGVGNVGRAIERICRPYGITLFLNDPIRAEIEGGSQFVPLDIVTKECDIISFHTPLTREGKYSTFHLADSTFFDALEKDIFFINAARGEINDTEALLQALEKGKVRSAVIDCWEKEPNVNLQLLSKAEIATPHIAGFSADGKAKGTHMAVNAIKAFFHITGTEDGCIVLPAPQKPVIDLNEFDSSRRIESAVLHTLNLEEVNSEFKSAPSRFEFLRTHYPNPREFKAYTLLNATSSEYDLLSPLGFNFL